MVVLDFREYIEHTFDLLWNDTDLYSKKLQEEESCIFKNSPMNASQTTTPTEPQNGTKKVYPDPEALKANGGSSFSLDPTAATTDQSTTKTSSILLEAPQETQKIAKSNQPTTPNHSNSKKPPNCPTQSPTTPRPQKNSIQSKDRILKSKLGPRITGEVPKRIKASLNKEGASSTEYSNGLCLMTYLLIKAWKGQKDDITNSQMDQFINYSKNPALQLSFPDILQGFRKKNSFHIPEESFEVVCELIMICLTECFNHFNITTPLHLVNLSGTYFSEKKPPKAPAVGGSGKAGSKGKKVYLQDGVCQHKLFQRLDFWEACLLYSVSESKQKYDFHLETQSIDSGLIQDGFKSKIFGNFVSLAMFMKDFGVPKVDIGRLMYEYLDRYKMSEEFTHKLQTYINSTFK